MLSRNTTFPCPMHTQRNASKLKSLQHVCTTLRMTILLHASPFKPHPARGSITCCTANRIWEGAKFLSNSLCSTDRNVYLPPHAAAARDTPPPYQPPIWFKFIVHAAPTPLHTQQHRKHKERAPCYMPSCWDTFSRFSIESLM